MKTIIRNYGIGMNQYQKQATKAQMNDMVITRGTSKKPMPPRDLQVQSGPRGILVNWRQPAGQTSDIAGWRVYKDNENSLFAETRDPSTTQHFIDATSGSTPPTTNIFVSSINKLGVESQKVQVQAKATTESGAPTMPSTPPTYQIPYTTAEILARYGGVF